VLFVKSPLVPDPILLGGSHENDRRAGTENLAAIVGFAEALERFVPEPVFSRSQLDPLGERLIDAIERIEGVHFVGSRDQRLANTVSFVVENTDSIALLAGLDMEGICASSGSACSAGSLEPSHVISALGLPVPLANALVRFSMGRDSTLAEVKSVERVLPEVIRRAQRLDKRTKKL
jgi:cysteine desulfurase